MKKLNIIISIVAFSLLLIGFLKANNVIDIPMLVKQKTGLNVGDVAPEIELPDPNGKEIKLTSLRKSVVLIDFWASWCKPCRIENPTIVAVYNKYKDKKFKNGKSFKIYSVSLDRDLAAWKKAITDDNLTWTEHVSDLKAWQSSAAQLYGVNSIPTNFLIDGNGVILAKRLRGEQLEAELKKHLK
jgi:thiol-disulfide isomerase/thioredoxin